MVGDEITCPAARDEVVSRVEAERPLETIVPLGGAFVDDTRQLCSDSEASGDRLLSMGAMAPVDGTDVCCARLDDFDWVLPDRVPDIFTSERDMEVYLPDLAHDQEVLPDRCPVVSAGVAAVPMPLAVGAETVSPVVFQEEFAPVVIPLAEEGAFRVGMIGLVEAGSDLPVGLLHSERVLPDCSFSDVGVLVPEMSQVVSAGGAAVLMSLPAVTEVFSSAIFAGGRC